MHVARTAMDMVIWQRELKLRTFLIWQRELKLRTSNQRDYEGWVRALRPHCTQGDQGMPQVESKGSSIPTVDAQSTPSSSTKPSDQAPSGPNPSDPTPSGPYRGYLEKKSGGKQEKMKAKLVQKWARRYFVYQIRQPDPATSG